MRHILKGNRYKAAAGIGMLILIGSITTSLLLSQRDDRPAAIGKPVSAPAPLGLPSPTGRITVEDRGQENSGSTFSTFLAGESFELKIQRNASAFTPAPGEGEPDQDEDSDGTGRFNAGDGATVSDSADLDTGTVRVPPPQGGPSDSAHFADSAGLVVRSATGNVKQQETVK